MVELAKDVREGDILAHKYRVERVLGAGAMGVVVAAYHLGLDTRVAIKLLHPQMLASEEVVLRFAREARAAAKITGEHVARVLDVGVLEGGAPFIVMELLDGADLQKWLERHGPLPIAQAVDFVLQASEALAEAHRLGIVHRDLKPSNLFCVPRADGTLCVKVVDFGISKMMSSGAAASGVSMTSTATVIGTPLYMSPEQMESSRGVDARADVWALGVILFELLTGQSPFFGESLPEVFLKIATRAPPPMHDFRPDVPKQIEAAILKCLEKDREKRWQTVADFCLAIASCGPARAEASVERIRRTTQAAAGSASAVLGSQLDWQPSPPTLAIETMGAVGSTGTSLSRRQTGVLGAFVIVVAGIAVVSTLYVTRMNGPTQQPRASSLSASSSPSSTVAVALPPATSGAPSPTVAEPPVAGPTEAAPRASTADVDAPEPAAAKTRRTRSAAATSHLRAPQPPAQPEPPKSSSPYDERL